MRPAILSFLSESRLISWFKEKYQECGDSDSFSIWLHEFFSCGSEVTLNGEPCEYWACWGAGALGERPVVEEWELAKISSWTTNEIKNRIWNYVSSKQPIPGCVSLLSLRMELLNKGEDPHGYHNT